MEQNNKPNFIYLLLIVVVGLGIISYVLKLGSTVTFAIYLMLAIGFLSVKNSKVGETINSIWTGYIKFTVGLMIATGLAYLFRILNAVSVDLSPRLLIILLIVWGVLLVVAILLLIVEAYRNMIFGWLRSQIGWGAPFAYSYALMWAGIFFFSSLTYSLIQSGSLAWVEPNGREITINSINDFYLWQFMNAIPVFKVTDTLLISQPLQYNNSSVGSVLLLFKIVVISPVIGAFVTYWRDSIKNPKEEKPKNVYGRKSVEPAGKTIKQVKSPVRRAKR